MADDPWAAFDGAPATAASTATAPVAAVAPAQSPADHDPWAQFDGKSFTASAAPSPGPQAFLDGGGILPDGSATRDPAVWQRWMQSYQPPQTTGPAEASVDPNAKDAPKDNRLTGYVPNVAAGANAAIAGTLGLPVDLATGGINLVSKGVNAVAGTNIPMITDPVGGSNTFKQAMGVVGANPDNVRADGIGQELARGAGGGVVSALAPAGIASGLVRAGVVGAPAAAGAVEALGGVTPTNMLLGATSGAAGEAAASVVPDQYKPLAGLAGGLFGVGVPAIGLGVGKAAINQLMDYARPGIGRMNLLLDTTGRSVIGSDGAPVMASANQAQLAGRDLNAATSDPAAVRSALSAPTNLLMPNDNPTVAALTRDPGLTNLEYNTARTGSTDTQTAFRMRQDQQNDARVGAIQGVAPNGSAEAFPPVLRAQADAVDAAGSARVAQVGQQTQADLARTQAAEQARVDALRGNATGQATALPGDLPAGSESLVGDYLRAPLDAAQQAAKAHEGALWKAVDPEGTLAVNAHPIRNGVSAIQQDTSALAKPIAGEEAGIMHTAAGLPDAISFRDLAAFRGRITDAIRAERGSPQGDPQAVRRMSMLLGDVHTAMEGGVSQQAASDAQAVASGAMNDTQTMLQRINAWADRQRDQQDAAAVGSWNIGGAGSGRATTGRATSDVGAFGTMREEGERFGGAQGVQSLPSQPLTPNFDAAAQQRYADARGATADRVATYKNAPGVGQVLQQGQTADSFKTPSNAVPNIIVSVGPKGRDVANSYLAAGGSHQHLTEAAAFSLRREAMRPDGTLDPQRYAAWANKRSSFLSAIPDAQARFGAAADASRTLDAGTLESGLRLKEATAAAQRTVDDAVAARAAANKQIQNSALGPFLNGEGDTVSLLGKVLSDKTNGETRAGQLADAVKGNPNAEMALRRATAEYIERTFIGSAMGATSERGAIYSAKFQNFLQSNGRILSQVLSPEDMAALNNVAASMQRDFRSAQVGVGSQTAQLVAGHGKDLLGIIGHHLAGTVTGGGMGASLGFAVAGAPGAYAGGAIGGVLNKAVQAAREAGLQNVEQLKAEALLNPTLFKLLTAKVTPKNHETLTRALTVQLGRIALVSAASGYQAPRHHLTGVNP